MSVKFVFKIGIGLIAGAFLVWNTGRVSAQTNVVDASTLTGKFVMGYQGWHACQGDGSEVNKYIHWGHADNARPSTNDLTDDIWPDLSEFPTNELFPSSLTMGNGQPLMVYSAYLQNTVLRHFKWMSDYGLDGVMLQRFTKDVFTDATWAQLKNTVLTNVEVAAQTYGRVFCVMYDISNDDPTQVTNHLETDWAYVTGAGFTNSSRYLHHKGKPLVAIWGFGFTGVGVTTNDALTCINFFKSKGCTVMGGVPTNWRTLNGDSQTNSGWLAVYHAFDVVSPWTVGRYTTAAQADSYQAGTLVPDIADIATNGTSYMPVVFPGYSASNLNGGTLNGIPRLGGTFYWRQIYDAMAAGCKMIYGAMFDEIDEGTATYKLAPTSATIPQGVASFGLNVDGYSLPSDWYLQVARAGTKALHGSTPLNGVMPLSTSSSITVTSPNGGEFWVAGWPATVTWTSTGVVGNVSIDLSVDGGASFRSLAYNVANNGSNTVTVPFWASTNCLVRVEALSNAPVDWSDNAFTIRTNTLDTTTHLQPLWSLAPGSAAYLTGGTSTYERGLAYNALSNELIIVHHGTDGLSVDVLNGDTGAFIKTLNVTGVSGGGFLLDRIGVTGDGVIYAGNVSTSVGSSPFKLYRWANSDPNTIPTVAYSGTAGFASGVRAGDSFALRGSGLSTQILLGSRNDKTASLLTTADGTNFTATLLNTDAVTNGLGICVAFGTGNSFWGKTNGLPLTHLNFNTTNQTATTALSLGSNSLSLSFGSFGIDPANQLLATITSGNGTDQLDLYDISVTNPPALLDSATFPGTNANSFFLGTVVFSGNRLYALDSDNGILAFTVGAQRTADLRFDVITFCCGCSGASICETQFLHLDFPSQNGHYLAMGGDTHRSEVVSNGNVLAIYYNTLNDNWTIYTGAQQASNIDYYASSLFTTEGPKPGWVILNEISAGTWPTNASYRSWVHDVVHSLHNTYGYTVILYAPFSNPGNNSSDWQAVSADAYIGIENYLSGSEIQAQNFSVSWCQSQYQSSITSYGNVGVPRSKLMLGEDFSQTLAGTGYGRDGVSYSDWDSAILARSQAAANIGFPGYLSFAWAGDDMNVSVDDEIHFEDTYASVALPNSPPGSVPTISTQPSGVTATAGANVSFTVASSGTTPLLFQWLKNGVALSDDHNVSGSQGATLNVSSIQATDTGTYSVMVSNTFGSITSSAVVLALSGPIVIATQPASQTNNYGTTAAFSVGATGDTPVFKWQKNSVNLTDGGNVFGSATANLTLTNVSADNDASYQVVITNSHNSVTSSPATLTVIEPAILVNPTNQSAIVGSTTTLSVTATGRATLAYQWKKNSTNLVDGGVVSGSTTAVLTLTALGQNDAGSYTVSVSNSKGQTLSAQAILTVADVPPSITGQPQSLTNNAGAIAIFTVASSGNGVLYQWFKNLTNTLSDEGNVFGSATSSLTLTNVTFADAASYSVNLTNAWGGATSAVATLTVLYPFPYFDPLAYTPGAVLGDQTNSIGLSWAEVATSVSGPSVLVTQGNLSVPGLVASTGNSATFGGQAKSARFSFPAGNPVTSGTVYYSYILNVSNFSGISTSGVFVAGFNNSTGTQTGQPSVVGTRLYLRGTNGGFNIGTSKNSSTTTDWIWDPRIFTATDTIFLVGNYTFGAFGTNDQSQLWINPSETDFGAAAPTSVPLTTTNGPNITSGQIASFVFLQRSTSEPSAMVVDELRIGTTWASVTPANGPAIVTQPQSQTVGTGAPAAFSVTASGTPNLSYQWILDGTNISGATASSYVVSSAGPSDVGTYSVIVTNNAGSAASTNVTLTVGVAPSISSQPASQTVNAGSAITLAVTAAGAFPLSYQWNLNGAPLPGATAASYTDPFVSTNDAGTYFVVVTNAVGFITSSNAIVIVNVPPSITSDPVGLTVQPGDDAQFSVGAGGQSPLFYQWALNGTNIVGATTSALSLTDVQATNGGYYTVTITNAVGTAASDPALLKVLAPPLISGINAAGTNITIAFSSVIGLSYTLQYKENVYDIGWQTLPPALTATGNISVFQTTNSFLQSRYYQILGQ